MLPVKHYNPGDKMKVKSKVYTTNDKIGRGETKKELETVTVVRQYPHHVLVENKHGVRWSITNAEIYTLAVRE